MLGEKIKALRTQIGLNQWEIAAALGIDTGFISKIENSDKILSRSHLSKLAKILNTNEDELETLWVADKIFTLIKNEKAPFEALSITEAALKSSVK